MTGFRLIFIAAVAALSWPAAVPALEPNGSEFQVNTTALSYTPMPGVAAAPDGRFVVAWAGDGRTIRAQRYDATGAAVGSEFQVNTNTTPEKGFVPPGVAVDAAGNFMVTWDSYPGDQANSAGVFGRLFDSSGSPLTGEIQVNTTTDGDQGYNLGLAADGSGNFVAIWGSGGGPQPGVIGQRFDGTGAPLGSEFRVNTTTSGEQGTRFGQAVAMDSAGNFVVVWAGGVTGIASQVYGQRFDNAGAPVGTEFVVNTYSGYLRQPAVAVDPAGNFLVVWASRNQAAPGSGFDVFGRLFTSAGIPATGEFQVNTYTTADQGDFSDMNPSTRLRVASGASGDFLVVWESYAQDGDGLGVFGRGYSNSAAPLGDEFQINTYTTGDQDYLGVAADAIGNLTAVWGTQLANVSAQRFSSGLPPVHDSVVRPLRPINATLGAASPELKKKIKVEVRNADAATEVPGDTIKVTVDRGDCPPGMMIGTPDFRRKTSTAEDAIVLAGGKQATAVVPLTIHANDFVNHNKKAPLRCTLQVHADTQGVHTDPTLNNRVPVEVNVIDKHNADGAGTHESLIKSLSPVSASIADLMPGADKKVRPTVANADLSDIDPGDSIALSVDSILGLDGGACPWVTVSALDIDPGLPGTQSSVTVKSGKTKTGSLTFHLDPSVNTPNGGSPARCVAVVRATGPTSPEVAPALDPSNNTTQLVIDVIDKNDFAP